MVLWALSATLAVLAVGGAASLLTSQARFGRTDTQQAAAGPLPILRHVALGYADSVGDGEETIRTRITVLRDGVLLAVAAALLYAVIWPFTAGETGTAEETPQRPAPTERPTACPTTCTPTSPSRLATPPTSPSPRPTEPRTPSSPSR
jgi:hypothetical protein